MWWLSSWASGDALMINGAQPLSRDFVLAPNRRLMTPTQTVQDHRSSGVKRFQFAGVVEDADRFDRGAQSHHGGNEVSRLAWRHGADDGVVVSPGR